MNHFIARGKPLFQCQKSPNEYIGWLNIDTGELYMLGMLDADMSWYLIVHLFSFTDGAKYRIIAKIMGAS